MKKVYFSFVFLTFCLDLLFAQGQQLPNSNCNDWSGPKFKDEIQPAGWNYSNVIQTVLGAEVKFNFAHREAGRSGQSGDYSMMVQDQDLEVAGIGETSPGYIALGQPWAYLEGLNVNSATAGTYGGLAWNSRPDTLSLWIRRTGGHWRDENYNILYYAWKGTAQGSSYKNKANGCTKIDRTDEESDIRIALDGNECQTKTRATQICEGWIWERKEYPNWTNIRIPIYYMNNEVPEKMNVILSASNYPNFRANNGLYAGNSLYIDDMELIYSASIQQLVIDDRIWEDFNPNTDEVQVYELGRDATSIPKIEAKRGIGSLTSPTGGKADFPGRVLSGSEISIEKGAIGDVTRIVVKSEDGKQSKTYSIRFVREASANTQLDGIAVNGQPIEKFNPKVLTYDYALPFGSVEMPVVTCTKHEEEQVVQIMQAASQTGTATILVTAANGRNTATYTVRFSVEELKDNTLKNILVNGQPVPGFTPTKTSYRISLPVDTETMPTIEAVSNYPQGMQTIVYTAPQQIDGGVYTIAVTTPGNPQPNTYKLTFKLEPSSYAYLKDLRLDADGQNRLEDFDPEKLTYSVALPLGTEGFTITPVKGDNYQTVEVQSGGLNGQSRVQVTAGDGITTNLYKINVTTKVSSETTLNAIYINDEPLQGFEPQVLSYTYDLPIGTTEMPVVKAEPGDEYQTVTITYGGLNGVTRILVTAGNGSTRLYQIQFHQQLSTNASLKMISVGGEPLPSFYPDKTEYDYILPAGTTILPEVSYEQGDAFQTISTRSGGVNGDYKIIVYSQQGTSKTYVIHFSCAVGKEALLEMIYLDGDSLEGFDPEKFEYFVDATTEPEITYTAKEGQSVQVLAQQGKKILSVTKGSASVTYTIRFGRKLSSDATLKAVYLNDEPLTTFDPTTLDYTIDLPAGSTLPQVDYVRNDEWQMVTAGYSDTTYRIAVQAENRIIKNTYSFTFVIGLYTATAPADIQLEGYTLDYDPAVTTYEVTIDKGAALPQVTALPQTGQRIVVNTLNNQEQQILVTAQNGDQALYTITYTRQLSSNAFLQDIVIDGVSLADFDPQVSDYIVTLPWRTQVIPNVMPIGALSDQMIVTSYCRPNGTMTIEVTAEDGVTQQTYTIAFPVTQSSNTLLEAIEFEGDVPGYTFVPTTTDYELVLPYGTTSVPTFEYEKQEPEQQVSIESRPIGDTTKVTVTAEDGTIRTYRFFFTVKDAQAENKLRLIQYHYTRENAPEEVITQTLTTNEQSIEVALPYGTKTFEVIYEKNYNEQVVFAQQGGILHPTILKVMANHTGYEDLTYTITPKVSEQNPAVLTDIKVNGVTIEGFDSNRFSYIVNVTSNPIVEYTTRDLQTMVQVLQQNSKHWQAKVTNAGYTHIYDMWYFYPQDIIPNGELTDWTNCTKTTSAQKPVGWNTIGDASGAYEPPIFGKYTPGAECSQAGDGSVYLKTSYVNICARNIPAFMTLGTATGTVNTNNSFGVEGGITFRNTPDRLSVRYKAPKVKNNNHIIYQVMGERGVFSLDETDATAVNDYKERVIDLIPIHEQSGTPSAINITLNSYYAYQGGLGTDGMGVVAEMYVDYVRFSYNSTLSALKVNGIEATLNDNAFAVTLPSCEQTAIPSLAFIGQVNDQAQLVTWSEENEGVRIATIRNFAEDGSYTDYTLSVTRPLDTRNSLAGIYINGHLLPSFREEQTEYTYTMTTSQLPDITYDGGSFLQTITMGYADSVVTISVMPEQGQTKVYTIKLQRQYSSNTQLQDIFPLEGFDPAVREYTIEGQQWPDFFFVKAEDKQHVMVQNGLFTITAEDGSVGTYQVKLQQPQVITSGQIKEFEIDGVVAQDFGGLQLSKTAERPTYVRFERQDLTDSVIFIQSDIAMQWQVIGTQTNTYTLTYPSEPSKNATLTAILVNDTLLSGFMPQVTTYELVTDSDFILTPVPAEASQRVEINKVGQLFQFVVTAQAGNTQTYTIDVQPTSSKDATLAELNLNGVSVPDFRPDSFTYVFTLPTPEVKVEEPIRPDIWFLASNANAKVEVEPAPLGQTSVITVTSQDGAAHCTYTLLIEAEPSHNAQLNGLIVNNVPLTTFQPDQYYYTLIEESDEVTVVWTAEDHFLSVQQVTDTLSPQLLSTHLYVTAQDGYTHNTYTVVNMFKPSDVDTLKAIYQNVDILPGFDPQTIWYEITLEPGERRFPDLDWEIGERHQQVRIDTTSQDTYHLTRQIAVTAADGHQKVYTIQHNICKSAVDTLQNIFINNKPLELFAGTVEEYSVFVDSNEQPVITFVAGDEYQQVSITTLPEIAGIKALDKALIMVEAENGNIRFYTIHFLLPLDNNAHLQMIYKDDQPLDNFDPDRLTYTVVLEKGAPLPAITWLTQTPDQQVYSSTVADTTSLLVIAEDGTSLTYKIFFQHKLSQVVDLAMINVNGIPMENFQSDIYQYEMFIAYGQPIPTLTAVKQEPEQTVTLTRDTVVSTEGDTIINVLFHVQAQDPTFENEYTVSITLGRNTDAYLVSIMLRGTALRDFDPANTDYLVSFPVHSDSAVFYTVADVAYRLSDPQATAVVTELDHHTLQIDVLAQDKQTRLIYTIAQQILLDDNNYLSELKVGGLDMPGFTPEWDFYTYYLEEGITPPEITALAQSDEATVSINAKAAGDTSIVVCESASKKVRKYYIYFAKSPINDTQSPTSRDVLLKYVPGSTDIVVATTRKNVTFCLYDGYGRLYATYKLPTVNTNFADIDIDADGYEHLFNFNNAQGLQIHLIPNQFYLYTFVEGNKHLIKSGKLLMR